MKKLSLGFRPFILLLVKWSGIGMTEGHGKIGGSVIQKGRSGFIGRVKVTPVNPRSSYQQEGRSRLASLSSTFRTLGVDVVAAWNAAANSGFTTTNVFGDTVKRTGHGLYVGLNLNLNGIGQATISNPPVAEGVESPLSIEPAAAAGANTMFINATFSGGSDVMPANTSLRVFATPPLSGGVSFTKSLYRGVTFLAATDDTGTTNIRAAYVSRFGPLVAGQRIGIQVQTINETTGESGVPFNAILVVAA